MNRIQRGLRWLGQRVLAAFFRRIAVENAGAFPADGPVIVVANHGNGLIDGALLACCLPRDCRLIAASTIWSYRPLVPLLRAVGVIPVFRRKDVGAVPGRNDGAFAAAGAVLAGGGALGLFPEGVSHDEPRLLPLRPGAARIAETAMRRHRAEAVRIVPVALVFEEKQRFRSAVTLRIGTPLDAGATLAAAPSGDPEAPVTALTRQIEDRLSALLAPAEPPLATTGTPPEPAHARNPVPLSALILAAALLPNALPWHLSRLFARGQDRDKRATWSLFTALLLFPAGWTLFAALCAGLTALAGAAPGLVAAAGGAALLSGPLLGLAALPVLDRRVVAAAASQPAGWTSARR